MTRLAANVDLVIGGLVTTRFGVVAFNDIGAVTLGATAIPVMINTRPMKRTVRSDRLLVFVDMDTNADHLQLLYGYPTQCLRH